jgi:hypothetical protein
LAGKPIGFRDQRKHLNLDPSAPSVGTNGSIDAMSVSGRMPDFLPVYKSGNAQLY